MESIDNLREYVLTAPSICSTTRGILVGYLDGIEREVEDMVPLPVDADGVPIHIGDVMEWRCGNGEFEVIGIGGNTLFYIDKDSNECEWTAAGDKRHHHAPTVEDVLEEFVARWTETHYDDIPALKAEYAAKLTLRGDE